MADTEADAFQSSLVDTISSCGRTLLDTINHILDYSKINSFERNWRNARKPGSKARGAASRRVIDKEAPPMMNIYATVDVAAITEEVVEGVFAGQIYQDISSTEATDFSKGAKAEALDRGLKFGDQSRIKLASTGKSVEVILDFAHENYVFITQPGALKRVGYPSFSHDQANVPGYHEHFWERAQVYAEGIYCCQTKPWSCEQWCDG